MPKVYTDGGSKMTKPFAYQLEPAEKFAGSFRGRILIADEMGLGKTLQALLCSQKMPEAKPIVCVCPSSIKWVWRHEASLHCNMRSEILEGTRPPFNGFLPHRELLIINYDILGAWLKYLRRLKPQLVIIDECHYLASLNSQRTRHVQSLCEKVPNVIALSGTPLINRPKELWPTLNILRPDLFPAFLDFALDYCKPERKPWGWDYNGATNLKGLHKLLTRKLMVRRRKQDVLADLPPKRRIVVPLDIVKRREYDHALNDFLGWMRKRNPTKVRRAAHAERLVKLGYLKRLAAKLKMQSVYEWLDNFLVESEGKIILFAVHKKIIKRLRNRYSDMCTVVDGSITGDERRLSFKKFLTHSKCRILIGNIRAAGVGWSAKGVSTNAFVEFAWAPGSHTQAEDRIHGIGRGDKRLRSEIFYLVARDTIESKLVKILQDKQKTSSAVLDGGKGNDLDVFDLLEKALQTPEQRKWLDPLTLLKRLSGGS